VVQRNCFHAKLQLQRLTWKIYHSNYHHVLPSLSRLRREEGRGGSKLISHQARQASRLHPANAGFRSRTGSSVFNRRPPGRLLTRPGGSLPKPAPIGPRAESRLRRDAVEGWFKEIVFTQSYNSKDRLGKLTIQKTTWSCPPCLA
jgi:hypothetical protein